MNECSARGCALFLLVENYVENYVENFGYFCSLVENYVENLLKTC